MKFSDGFWQIRPGVHPQYASQAYQVKLVKHGEYAGGEEVHILAPSKNIINRGDVLNRPALDIILWSPFEDIIAVRIQNHKGGYSPRLFDLPGKKQGFGIADEVKLDDSDSRFALKSGRLEAVIQNNKSWRLNFQVDENILTSSREKSIAHVNLETSAAVSAEPVGITGVSKNALASNKNYTYARLSLGVGELVYGLGERFGPFVKNGQTVDIWNSDGGTSSEQSYKNIPFYLTNRGYGVFVNYPGHVSYEVGSESVEEVQFSVPGEELEYFIIYGPSPKEILRKYTQLLGRPAQIPAWSYGIWLSTSFTTQYDEKTVNNFIDGMLERKLPLSVFHFDCFWMREFQWTDFEWDPQTFSDPEGMLTRLHQKNIRTSAWINPYIAQRATIFKEAKNLGYLVKRPDGTVWQWDMWQAGMALVDFTNPDALIWFQEKVRALLNQGIDAVKTDFGERIPIDVVWHDGTDPNIMHNLYTQLYNAAVFEVIQEIHGLNSAVLFARSATAGGQKHPVHWGGDNYSSFESMAESLRGGLSLMMSGFGFWSHDIGGFEGTPDQDVFKRWIAFGLMSSHSRFHGSSSYRVPWLIDAIKDSNRDGSKYFSSQNAVEVTSFFSKLKMKLMPYLYEIGHEAHSCGIPFMRPMVLEFPEDLNVRYLDQQYMIGSNILVAPVMSRTGKVDYYLPEGKWTHLITGQVSGGGWKSEEHDFLSMPIWVREGTILVTGSHDDKPDYDYFDLPRVTLYPEVKDGSSVQVTNYNGIDSVTFTVFLTKENVKVVCSNNIQFEVCLLAKESVVRSELGSAVFPL